MEVTVMKVQSMEDLLYCKIEVPPGRGKGLGVYIFYIDGLLIDAGPARMEKELVPLLDQWEIEHVILTHHHEDHVGLANWIQENKKIPIYVHETGVKASSERQKLPHYRESAWGERKPFQPKALGDTFKTTNYTWDIIHTPGHAYDHVALFNSKKGLMIGGDLYVHPTPTSMFSFESVPTLIASLKKILAYDFETYICSHVGIIEEGRKAIEYKLNYLMGEQEKVLSLHYQGMLPKEIRETLYPKLGNLSLISDFENSPDHLVNSILRENDLVI